MFFARCRYGSIHALFILAVKLFLSLSLFLSLLFFQDKLFMLAITRVVTYILNLAIFAIMVLMILYACYDLTSFSSISKHSLRIT